MTPEKLKANLKKLRSSIARKPVQYEAEYAITIHDSFTKYTNTRTINLLVSVNEILKEVNWLLIISIGKYFEQNGSLIVPVGIQVHHGLVDGVHSGTFTGICPPCCESPLTIFGNKGPVAFRFYAGDQFAGGKAMHSRRCA
jgi:hypothetical protein